VRVVGGLPLLHVEHAPLAHGHPLRRDLVLREVRVAEVGCPEPRRVRGQEARVQGPGRLGPGVDAQAVAHAELLARRGQRDREGVRVERHVRDVEVPVVGRDGVGLEPLRGPVGGHGVDAHPDRVLIGRVDLGQHHPVPAPRHARPAGAPLVRAAAGGVAGLVHALAHPRVVAAGGEDPIARAAGEGRAAPVVPGAAGVALVLAGRGHAQVGGLVIAAAGEQREGEAEGEDRRATRSVSGAHARSVADLTGATKRRVGPPSSSLLPRRQSTHSSRKSKASWR
jgi:hypothetical protein